MAEVNFDMDAAKTRAQKAVSELRSALSAAEGFERHLASGEIAIFNLGAAERGAMRASTELGVIQMLIAKAQGRA